MENFLIYIGKAALAAGTFYLAYLALFQHQKHFVFNRIYLPVSLAVSFLIPLITFTTVNYIEPIKTVTTNSFAYLPDITVITEPEFVYQWYHYLFGIYLLGVAGFLFYLLLGHIKALNIIRFSRLKQLFNAKVNVTQKDVHPFSFFNKIVLSEKTLDNPNLEVIVSHEKIHVDEKHTLDILFAEILFLLQWFNPFAWLIKDAMRNNLEYKTDHQITQNNNAEAYQLAMVGLAHKEGVAPFLTALNGSQLKNRIIMMKKKTENKYSLLKQLVVLPVLAVLIMGLSNKEVKTEIASQATEQSVERQGVINVSGKVVSRGDMEPIEGAGIYSTTGEKLASSDEQGKFTVSSNDVEKLVVLKEGFHPKYQNLKTDINKDAQVTVQLDVQMTADSQKKMLERFVLKYKTEDEILGKIYINPEVWPEFYGGETALKQTIQQEIRYPKDALENGIVGVVYVSFVISETGKVIAPEFSRGVHPSLNEEAVRVVGNLPDWKPGKHDGENVHVNYTIPVNFEITEPQPKKHLKLHGIKTQAENSVKGKVTDEKGIPVPGVTVLIKGTKMGTITNKQGNYELKSESPIETLVVIMKGFVKQEVKVAGSSVLNIVLKADKDSEPSEWKISGGFKGVVSKDDGDFSYYTSTSKNGMKLTTTGDAENQPLYIIDGKEVENVNNIDKDNIESISVLKGENAANLFGEKGKNGVVLINTKTSGVKGHVHKIEDESKIKVVGYGKQKKVFRNDSIQIRVDGDVLNQPLYVIDGKEVENANDLDKDNIESISILKGKTGTEVYGEKAKNGVVLINTKTSGVKGHVHKIEDESKIKVVGYGKQKKVFRNDSIQIRVDGDVLNQPLYVIDGKEVENANDLKKDDIESVSILKGKTGTEVYGEKAKNGVVLINTKASGVKGHVHKIENDKKQPLYIVDGKKYDGDINDISPKDISSIEVRKNQPDHNIYDGKGPEKDKIIIQTKTKYNTDNNKPLIYVDGIKSDEDINNLNPENIKSVSVLKDASAIAAYGPEAKDGVILITTKSAGIKSELALRKFIAKTIKYPEIAQQANKSGRVELFVRVNSDGIIYSVSREKVKDAINIDKVVVVGYATEKSVDTENETKDEVLDLALLVETKHVINQLPRIEVTEFKGKTLAVSVEFILQSDESSEITSALELRRFIAQKIKYPLKAQKANAEGTAQVYVEFDKLGNVKGCTSERTKTNIRLDEVVVTALNNENAVVKGNASEDNANDKLLINETKRVVDALPVVNIPDFKGKTVAITVKFILQDK